MEVNNLSYKLYRYLIKNEWSNKGEYNEKFFFLISERYNLKIALPIKSKSKDFYIYMKGVLDLVSSLYPKDDIKLNRLKLLNENLKKRFEKEWIIREYRSQIPKIDIAKVYIPKKLKL